MTKQIVPGSNVLVVNDDGTVTALAGINNLTPAAGLALALVEQTVLGRITGGVVVGLTAAQIRTLADVWTTVKKAADESVQSDITVSADADLVFAATANKTYAVRGRIWFSTPAAADFKFRFGFSGTSIFIHEVSIPCGSATETVGIETASPTTTISCLGTGTTGGYVEFDGVLVTDGSDRAFSFQWAQVTSTASNTTVQAGSYIEYLQVN